MAECPKEDPQLVPDFPHCNPEGYCDMIYGDEILAYLNSGGTISKLVTILGSEPDASWGLITDLTGDGVNEVVYRGMINYDVFICRDGKYEDLLDFAGDFDATLGGTPDLNKNGIQELLLYNISHYGSADLYIFEWDGSDFRSLISVGEVDSVLATYPGKIVDTNGDGLKEIVIVDDIHEQESWPFGIGSYLTIQRPLRNQITTLGWNGQNFVDLTPGNDTPPQYRFQAVQDGDEQVRFGNYAGALDFYRAVIFDDRLDWWSPERREYEIRVLQSQYEPTPTVFPTPAPDDTEYSRLAAYAYYRIMLLHFVQGHKSDAGTVYKTLEQKFSNNPYGRPYYEMATIFLEQYQATHNMYESCAAAIQYAEKNPVILVPLGSDYHGGYSHTYVPADVCPFR